jgi:hypothetical protein
MFYLRGSGETAVNHWHEKGFSVSLPTAKKCSLNIPGAPKTTSLRGATWPNRVQDEARGAPSWVMLDSDGSWPLESTTLKFPIS